MLTFEDVMMWLEAVTATELAPISVYWVPTSGSRSVLAEAIRGRRFPTPVVPIVLRKQAFADPNSVLSDIVELMDDYQQEIIGAFALESVRTCCILALLTKAPLRIPQVGSPVTLPGWFPIRAGQTLDVHVQDVTWEAASCLNNPALRIDDIRAALVELEDALLNRLTTVALSDHKRTNSLLQLFRAADKDVDTYQSVLDLARASRSELTRSDGFRPTLRKQKFIVSRLAAIALSTAPSKCDSVSEALVVALDLPEGITLPYESILAVLQRPQPFSAAMSRRFARALLAAVGFAYQLVTAAAHADDYDDYPVVVLRALGGDLCRSLEGCREGIAYL
jgi:hypothetical protein